jgi:tetratricopeptide (TPR) repeat protein
MALLIFLSSGAINVSAAYHAPPPKEPTMNELRRDRSICRRGEIKSGNSYIPVACTWVWVDGVDIDTLFLTLLRQDLFYVEPKRASSNMKPASENICEGKVAMYIHDRNRISYLLVLKNPKPDPLFPVELEAADPNCKLANENIKKMNMNGDIAQVNITYDLDKREAVIEDWEQAIAGLNNVYWHKKTHRISLHNSEDGSGIIVKCMASGDANLELRTYREKDEIIRKTKEKEKVEIANPDFAYDRYFIPREWLDKYELTSNSSDRLVMSLAPRKLQKRAKKLLNKAREIRRDDSWIERHFAEKRIAEAEKLLAQGEYVRSMYECKKVKDNCPWSCMDPTLLLIEGRCHAGLGEIDEAIKDLERVPSARGRMALGELHMKAGRNAIASACLEQAQILSSQLDQREKESLRALLDELKGRQSRQ